MQLRYVRHTLGLPHLFKVVELADLGLEDVHHDIARIDQNPLALRHTLNADALVAGFCQLFLDLVGDGADMPL